MAKVVEVDEINYIDFEDLTNKEKKNYKAFEKEIEFWRDKLSLSSAWTIDLVIVDDDIMGDKQAYADISTSEYWDAEIGISRDNLGDISSMRKVISHEMVHILSADYHRAGLSLLDNDKLHSNFIYLYEQLVSRISKILCKVI